jgi:hypothetical protein
MGVGGAGLALRGLEHRRIELGEGGGEDQLGPVLGGGLLQDPGVALGDIGALEQADAGHAQQRRHTQRVGLVEAAVVLAPAVDDLDHEARVDRPRVHRGRGRLRRRPPLATGRRQRDQRGQRQRGPAGAAQGVHGGHRPPSRRPQPAS